MKLLGIKMNLDFKDKVKEAKVPTDYGMLKKMGRGLVVVFMLYMVALSVIYLTDAKGREFRHKTERVDDFFTSPEKYLNQQGYYSFAGQFLRDYLTYDGLERDMKIYSNQDIPISWPRELKVQKVEETYPISITRINENQAVVRVGAFVSSIFSAKIQGDPDVKKQKTLYFDLAVYENEGDYVLSQLPQVVATTAKAMEKFKPLKINEATGEVAAAVMADVESFIKAYLEGSENDIAYFTDLKLKGLKGNVKYSGIEKSQVYILPEAHNKALVKIDVLTDVEGIGMKQHYEISLEKKDKWKVTFIGAICPDFELYLKPIEEEIQ